MTWLTTTSRTLSRPGGARVYVSSIGVVTHGSDRVSVCVLRSPRVSSRTSFNPYRNAVRTMKSTKDFLLFVKRSIAPLLSYLSSVSCVMFPTQSFPTLDESLLTVQVPSTLFYERDCQVFPKGIRMDPLMKSTKQNVPTIVLWYRVFNLVFRTVTILCSIYVFIYFRSTSCHKYHKMINIKVLILLCKY